ncbi:Odorant receptor 49b [Eufriesea mexicana]|nr:Odorant receptor 49b [Eufriesea mexicana]
MEKFARSTGEPGDTGRSFSHGNCDGKERKTRDRKPKLTSEVVVIQRATENRGRGESCRNSSRRSIPSSELSRSQKLINLRADDPHGTQCDVGNARDESTRVGNSERCERHEILADAWMGTGTENMDVSRVLVLGIFHSQNDITNLMQTACNFFVLMKVIFDLILCKKNYVQLQLLIREIKAFVDVANDMEFQIIQRYMDRYKFFFSMTGMGYMIAGISFCVAPLFSSQELPAGGWIPFSIQSLGVYYTVYAIEVCCIFQTVLCIGVDFTIAILLSFPAAKLDILGTKLQHVTGYDMLMQSVGVVCQYLPVVVSGCAQLLIFSWPADDLRESSLRFAKSLNDVQWLGKPRKMKSAVIVMMQRSQKTLLMTMSGFLPPLSLEYFASFLRTVSSYFMATKTMIDEHERTVIQGYIDRYKVFFSVTGMSYMFGAASFCFVPFFTGQELPADGWIPFSIESYGIFCTIYVVEAYCVLQTGFSIFVDFMIAILFSFSAAKLDILGMKLRHVKSYDMLKLIEAMKFCCKRANSYEKYIFQRYVDKYNMLYGASAVWFYLLSLPWGPSFHPSLSQQELLRRENVWNYVLAKKNNTRRGRCCFRYAKEVANLIQFTALISLCICGFESVFSCMIMKVHGSDLVVHLWLRKCVKLYDYDQGEIKAFIDVASDNEFQIIQRYMDRYKFFFSMTGMGYMIAGISFCVTPLFSSQELPAGGWIPFSIQSLGVYCTVYAIEVYWIFQTVLCIGVDFTVAILLSFPAAKLDILGTKLQHVTGYDMLMQSVGVVCQYLPVVVSGCAQLFIFSWPADDLRESSVRFAKSLNDVQWLGKPRKLKSAVIVMMQRSQKTLLMTMSGFLPPLSLEYFASFLRTVSSYFMATKTMIEYYELIWNIFTLIAEESRKVVFPKGDLRRMWPIIVVENLRPAMANGLRRTVSGIGMIVLNIRQALYIVELAGTFTCTWPIDPKSSKKEIAFHNFRWVFTTLNVILLIIFLILAIFHVRDNIAVLMQTTSETTALLEVFFDLILCRKNSCRLQVLIAKLKVFLDEASENERTVIQGYIDRYKVYFSVTGMSYMFGAASFCFVPFFTGQELPADGWIPFSIESYGIFCTIYVVEAYCVLQTGFSIFVDFMIAILFSFSAAKLDILGMKLRHVKSYDMLVSCIKEYQEIIRYVEDIKVTVEFLLIKTNATMACAVVCGAMPLIYNQSLSVISQFLPMVLSGCLHLFVISWPADDLRESSIRFAKSISDIHWLGEPRKTKSTVVIMMIRSQKAFLVTMGGVLPPLSLEYYARPGACERREMMEGIYANSQPSVNRDFRDARESNRDVSSMEQYTFEYKGRRSAKAYGTDGGAASAAGEIKAFIDVASDNEFQIIQRYMDRYKFFFSMTGMGYMIAGISFCVAPLFSSQELPAGGWIPFSIQSLVVYCTVYAIEVYWIFQTVLCIGVDFTVAILLSFPAAKLDILGTKLQHVTGYDMLMQSVGVVCQYLPVVVSGCAQLFIFSWPADDLRESSLRFAKSLNDVQWLGKPRKMKSAVIVMMQRSQKTLLMTMSGFLPPLSLEYFASFLRTVSSYFMATKTMIES